MSDELLARCFAQSKDFLLGAGASIILILKTIFKINLSLLRSTCRQG